jgi:prolipoprotein diacylglyceryltransferase
MQRPWIRLGLAITGSLVVWFTIMIGAIVVVSSLSRQDAISLMGGIAIFAVLISAALIAIGAIWVAWYRDHRRRAGR